MGLHQTLQYKYLHKIKAYSVSTRAGLELLLGEAAFWAMLLKLSEVETTSSDTMGEEVVLPPSLYLLPSQEVVLPPPSISCPPRR